MSYDKHEMESSSGRWTKKSPERQAGDLFCFRISTAATTGSVYQRER